MVGRADTWRMRLDATTNWAIGATAAVATVAVGNPSVPHAALFIATLLTLAFLLLEGRRLTFYHLWQQRVLALERSLIAPAVAPGREPEGLESLVPQLGRTVPSMSLGKAIARRIRRVYVYLFAAQVLAWLLKLGSQPEPVNSVRELVSHARIGPVPGPAILALVALALVAALLVALFFGGPDRGADDGR